MNMEKIKVIKTKEDYQAALELAGSLVAKSPDSESEDGEKLALLTALIEDYEAHVFPETLPDPVDAILFRMEQENLKPKDLVQYIGSPSKVSEVLSRKRPLTISMMRALEAGLGIPARVLLRESNSSNITWNNFPINEMEKRGYFGHAHISSDNIQSYLEDFFRPVGSPFHFLGLLRKTNYIRSTR